ncbi:hypothetical protein ACFWF7_42515 [Nocardia sp. NPDC060256]|uniref:hypothetical protein n=1 Tax=unclassified Nocardia TaxID=2637762 RepID=UPI00364C3BA2
MTILDRLDGRTLAGPKAGGGECARSLSRSTFAAERGGVSLVDRLIGEPQARAKVARSLHIRGDAPRPQRERWSMSARCEDFLVDGAVDAGFEQDAVVG